MDDIQLRISAGQTVNIIKDLIIAGKDVKASLNMIKTHFPEALMIVKECSEIAVQSDKVTEEIIKGLEAKMLAGWEYYYYRTRNGAEIDLILDGDFGILPIEIKYGLKTDKSKITSLRKFIKDNNLPFGIVINNSEEVTMLAEGVIQIPARLV